MGTEMGKSLETSELNFLNHPENHSFQLFQEKQQTSDNSMFRVHPETGLIVREGADIYTWFPRIDIQDLEFSLKMYLRKPEINQNDFDHATQIFSYLYLQADSEKKIQYLDCFNKLYEKILTGNFDEKLKKEMIAFSQIFLQQIQTISQVKTVLENQ